jgi:hypothetical protein
MAILFGLAVSVGASASPPMGNHEYLRPTVGRYAVTLRANPKKLGPGSCPRPMQRELVLVDVNGAVVEVPFVVPILSNFMLTEIVWTARPRRIDGVPGTGKPFDPAQEVLIVIDRRPASVEKPDGGLFLPADRVFPTYAAGKHAFTTGNSYAMLDTLCAEVLLPDDYGGATAELTSIVVYGYVDDLTRTE